MAVIVEANVADLSTYLGKTGLLRLHGLGFVVAIKDVRRVFGRLDFMVHPIDGQGSDWVSASSVSVLE